MTIDYNFIEMKMGRYINCFLYRLNQLIIIVSTIYLFSCGDSDNEEVESIVEEPKVAISYIEISKSSAKIAVGDTLHLSCNITPVNATDKNIHWTSSNEELAEVSSDGVVTAKAIGDCEITATPSSIYMPQTCKLHIIDEDLFEAVDLGLPSGIKWGRKDVNSYYAWGEIESKNIFYWER